MNGAGLLGRVLDLRISGDGTKIFGLSNFRIEARSMRTGEDAGYVRHQDKDAWEGALVVHGSKVWLASSKDRGWDFGGQEVSTFSLSEEFSNRLRLNFIDRSTRYSTQPAWIQDNVTGRPVFHLQERYVKHGTKRRWDGRYIYLVVGSPSGGWWSWTSALYTLSTVRSTCL